MQFHVPIASLSSLHSITAIPHYSVFVNRTNPHVSYELPTDDSPHEIYTTVACPEHFHKIDTVRRWNIAAILYDSATNSRKTQTDPTTSIFLLNAFVFLHFVMYVTSERCLFIWVASLTPYRGQCISPLRALRNELPAEGYPTTISSLLDCKHSV